MAADSEATERRGPGIDWPATFAGAGAAVTVAVLLSTLGAAGTLIGAALGSVVATVSTALYKQGIESSRRRVAEVQAAALEREAARAHRHSESSEVSTGEVPVPPAPAGNRWAALPWKRLAVLAAVVFLIAVVVISAIELIAGKSVSSITGGTDGKDRTSIGGVLGEDDSDDDRRKKGVTPSDTATPTPSDTASATVEPTGATTSATPSESATPSATATVTETVTQTAEPSTGESAAPTDATTP
ncbi:hypothetical protein CFH99_20205 [Nocardioides aromaticivorans]|uniref:Uncharacterized protein n=1 Tax=Nocardioides aromaticivorans TaxID=200618 RepID=A0ABX7PPM9_9ACTN|nr:hypothetical protein [Nocardioides aromaticivorans]QSR27951.1 hypothetical protein CFH99_20205 [Nocardioides aromaticivorans]